jgi:Tfp pilus assembly protein PilV
LRHRARGVMIAVMSRGNSIVAGVVLIGILGTLSIALQATTPSTEQFSQTTVVPRAQVAATAATTGTGGAAKMGCYKGVQYIVRTVKGDIQTSCTKIDPACRADWAETPFTRADYEKSGGSACIPVIEQSQSLGAPNHPAPQCEKLPQDQCDLVVCTSDANCDPVKPNGTGEAFSPKEEALKNLIEREASGDTEAAKALTELKANPELQQGFDNAFKDVAEEQEQQIKNIQDELNACSAGGCTSERKAWLESQKKMTEGQIKAIKETQTRLASVQSGEASVPPPEKKPSTDGGATSGGGGDTGGQPSGSGDTFGKGLEKMMGGQGGGGGQPKGGQGNQSQNPHQQCSPKYFCSNGTLYWGSPQQSSQPSGGYYGNYCTNQVVEQCQHGCARVSGSELSTRCANAASNPNTPNTPGDKEPVASLTCNTGIMDVGMKASLKFSCKDSKSSKGGGFSTGGKLSGTASTTIAKPPAGSDTVSYGLTCKAEGGATDSDKCDIKINVPAVVLVANPQEVTAGASTTIGWIAQGMDSCTIKVLETSGNAALEEFNEDNKDITNVSGIAITPPLDGSLASVTFTLACTTKAKQEMTRSIKVDVTD